MRKSETLHFDDGEWRASLTIRSSNTLIGTRRAMLHEQAVAGQNGGATDAAIFMLRLYTFPDLIAPAEGTVELLESREPPAEDGTPGALITPGQSYAVERLPFDVFCELPEPLTAEWERATYRLNAHWLPVAPETAKKGETTSTNASPG